MRGEADLTFNRFLDMLESDEDPATVPGLSHLVDGQPVHVLHDAPPANLDEIPIPDLSLIAGTGKPLLFDRGIIPIQSSRGCPHQCNFCSVTPMFGHKMRFASKERVAEELDRRRGQGKVIFFYDDNFCAVPARTKELLDHLLTRKTFLPMWVAQVSVRAAKDQELLRLMKRSGCYSVYVGFESISEDALALHHKRQTLEDIRSAIRRFHENGIWVHGMFVTGSDAEDRKSIRDTARFAIDEDIDSIQFLILTPLPGTPVYNEMKAQGRLISTDWSRYDTLHTVFQPARMSPETLTRETFAAMTEVYSVRRMLGFLSQKRWMHFSTCVYAQWQLRKVEFEHRTRPLLSWLTPRAPAPGEAPLPPPAEKETGGWGFNPVRGVVGQLQKLRQAFKASNH